jgi:hypothetical protein
MNKVQKQIPVIQHHRQKHLEKKCNFIMINNILGTVELNRKQSNITQYKQLLPINNKVKHIKINKFKIQ